MSDKVGGEKLLYCSFCGKSKHEVRKLIAGPSAPTPPISAIRVPPLMLLIALRRISCEAFTRLWCW